MPIVSALHVYPIKSCAGFALDDATIDARGIAFDRAWMVVDAENQFVTQREAPRLAHVRPAFGGDGLTIDAPGLPTRTLPYAAVGTPRRVQVWSSSCAALDQGDAIAEWFSTIVGAPVRLVRMADGHRRRVDGRYAITKGDQTAFTDGYPFLLILENSLADLNGRMSEPLPMNRFRPNIVVSGGDPYADDGWRQVRIGEMTFDLVKPSSRCVMTQTDQETLAIGKEPLRTLYSYRRLDGKVVFGWNLIHHGPGRIQVGDAVEVVASREPAFA